MSLTPKNIVFEDYWGELLETLHSVIKCERVPRKLWNDKFSDVYALCVAKPEPLGPRLYTETKSFLETHVTNILKLIKDCGDENLISIYHKYWEEYSRGSQYVNSLYIFLNQQYVNRKKPTESDFIYSEVSPVDPLMEIGELAYEVWKRLLITPVQQRVVNAILEEIHRDRNLSSSLNHSVIHSVVHSLVTVDERSKSKSQLTLYKTIFEEPFLRATSEFYSKKASEYINKLTCCEYLEKAIQWIDDERLRATKYIHPSSHAALKTTMEERLASDHLTTIHGECEALVKQEMEKDLRNMYTLLKPIKAVGRLCECLEIHIKKTGDDMIRSLTHDNIHQQFVEAMLELHKKYHAMVVNVFNNDQQFIAVLDKACAAVINYKSSPKQYSRAPEMLVKYCDGLLRKSSKGVSDSDVEEKLTASITVFKYLSDKDIYQGVYQRMLCKRLIHRLSASMDAEENMINRLKQTCGYEFTNKLHRMFTDINISSDLNHKFSEDCSTTNTCLDHSFSILVLQAGAWPISSQKMPQFQLPKELERSVQTFEKFYTQKFSGRKLTWVHAYSTGELRINHLPKPYAVSVGLFQMGILLQYNESTSFTAEELRDRTKLEEKDWTRQIQPLVDSKIILEKDGVLLLNMEYANKRTKFKIPSVSLKEPPQESEKVRYDTDEDRKWQVQAALVRIMKARKIIKHNLLIEEVITQLKSRFSPSVSLIKKSIEALIEKQYMERTQDTKDEYSYVA